MKKQVWIARDEHPNYSDRVYLYNKKPKWIEDEQIYSEDDGNIIVGLHYKNFNLEKKECKRATLTIEVSE